MPVIIRQSSLHEMDSSPKCLSSHVGLLYMRWIHPKNACHHTFVFFTCDGFTPKMPVITCWSSLHEMDSPHKCLSSHVGLLYMRWIHPKNTCHRMLVLSRWVDSPQKCLSSHASLLYTRWIHPFTLRMPAILSHIRLLYWICDGFARLGMHAITRQSSLVMISTRDGFTGSPSERLP